MFELETMTAEQMHDIIDEHRDGPKIVPGTSATVTEIDPTTNSELSDAVDNITSDTSDDEAV